METFDVYTSIRILDGKPDDYRLGPWESVAEAEANIPLDERYKGLTLLVNVGGSAIDYHFKNGTQNGFLIKKTLGDLILPNMILSGGDMSSDGTGLIITVSPLSWLIFMITYQLTGETVLTLEARDAEFSRTDIIIATDSGLSVVTGIADASVLDPNLPEGSVVVGKILVTPNETVVSAPEPITASNLIPAFQPRRNYAKDEPIQVPGVGIYTANAKFKSGNNFVVGNWTLRASLSSAPSFSALTGSPADNPALNQALGLKADKTYTDAQDDAIELLITNLKAGSVETIQSLRDMISSLQTSDTNQANQLTQIMTLLDSDNDLLNSVQEIVDFIEANRATIDEVLTSKLNKSVYDAFIAQYATDLAGKEPTITASGSSADFWSGAKTFLNFASTLFASVLPAISAGVNTPIVAGISVKQALENLQAQISGLPTGGGGSAPVQVNNVSILSTGWSLVSGYYEYNYANASILSTSIVDLVPLNASVSAVKTAEILPLTTVIAGSVKIYSTNAPTSNITVNVIIF